MSSLFSFIAMYVTSENDQLAYENTNIRFMMNLLFTHYIYMYIEITTLN